MRKSIVWVLIAIGVVVPDMSVGQPTELSETIDPLIAEFMQLTGATAASVVVHRDQQFLFGKAYGFANRRGTTPTRTSSTMRIASCTKPLTRAAIHLLIDEGRIAPDTPVFDYLGIDPPDGELGDERIRQITVGHLLEHSGGWDRETTFDPLFEMDRISRGLRVRKPGKRHIVRYMWTQPLQFTPGTRNQYSNFGFLLLGLVIEKTTGESYIQSLRDLLGQPLGFDDLSLSFPARSARTPREVDYPRENDLDLKLRDSSSGVVTSAESLGRFMDAWWLDGQPRTGPRNMYQYQFGNHPGTTTALMEQRRDGIHYVILLNSRRDDSYATDNETIRAAFNQMLDRLEP